MRLATWNILHGRPVRGGRVSGEQLQAAAAGLDADVLALQEVDRAQPRSQGLDLTAEVAAGLGVVDWRFVPALVGSPTLHYRAAGEDDEQGSDPAYGVALLSRYPVLSWHVLRLAPAPVRLPVGWGDGAPWWFGDEPRVVVAARARTPHGLMTVAATHVSFLPGQSALQLRRVARWLRGLPGPRVLLGDLNMPSALATRISGFRSLARARTYPAPAPRLQLDHVLGHGDLPPPGEVTAWRLPVSDHRALSVDMG